LLVLAFARLVEQKTDRRARAIVAVGDFCLVMAIGTTTPLSRVDYPLPV